MAKTRRARIDAENDHRRVTRPRLRTIVKETRSYLTCYLRAQSGTIEYDRGSREVGYDEAIILLGGLWLRTFLEDNKVPSPKLWYNLHTDDKTVSGLCSAAFDVL